MPASDLHDPNDRDATGALVATLYCPGCDEYSGGGLCRVCRRGTGEFAPPAPPAPPFVAILCRRRGGCEVVAIPASDQQPLL